MTSARITKLLLFFALAAPFCAAQQPSSQPLQLTISQTSPKPAFRIDLKNVGKEPLLLYLGNVLGNGNQLLAVDLSVTDDKGKTIPLLSKVLYIAGTVDPIIVTLAPGNSYPFQIDLADFTKGGDYVSLSLPPGRYTLKAVYTGRDFKAVYTGRDFKAVYAGRDYRAETGFWKGTVTSNPLPFTIPEKTAQ